MTYSHEQLRQVIPFSQEEPVTAPIERSSSIANDVPLKACITKEHREFINSGVAQGGGNNAGAALARDLIDTAARLTYLGIPYMGEPRVLLGQFGSRCSPPLPASELDSIWKSAKNCNPTAALTDDAIKNCVKAWQRRQTKCTGNSHSSSRKKSNGGGCFGNGGNGSGIEEVSLRSRVVEILNREDKRSERTAAFVALASATGRTVAGSLTTHSITDSATP